MTFSVVFVSQVYSSDLFPVGSISRVWDNLTLMGDQLPVAGVYEKVVYWCKTVIFRR